MNEEKARKTTPSAPKSIREQGQAEGRCLTHDCPLLEGTAQWFHDSFMRSHSTKHYIEVIKNGGNHHVESYGLYGSSDWGEKRGEYIRVKYCPECRRVDKEWWEKHKPEVAEALYPEKRKSSQ